MKINIKKFATKCFMVEKTQINNTAGLSGTLEYRRRYVQR